MQLAMRAVVVLAVILGVSSSDDAAACSEARCSIETEEAREDADTPSLLQVERSREGSFPFKRQDARGRLAWGQNKKEARPLNANVLKIPFSEVFSVSNDEVPVGACISGGGSRAFTWTLGIFRALSELGLTGFDEISSVSGGTWFSALYMYAKGSDSELLGKATTPDKLTMQYLSQYDSKFGQRAVDAKNSILLRLALFGTPLHTVWQRFIGEAFLKPFGLDQRASYMAASLADVARIKKSNRGLWYARFIVPRADRKHKWRMMCTLFSPLDYTPSSESVVSFEVGPSYTGLLGFPNNSKVTYQPLEHLPSNKLHQGGPLQDDHPTRPLTRVVGGGLVETFAFGGATPKKAFVRQGGKDSFKAKAKLPPPEKPFTLADAVGISSMALAGELANTDAGVKADPRNLYWPIPGPPFTEQEEALQYEFGDGGSTDNSGLLSLLIRGTRRVLWVASSYQTLNMSYDWEGACAEDPTVDFDPMAAGVIDQVIDKFGYGAHVSSQEEGYFYMHNQVFDKPLLLPLSCELWRLVKVGEPAVVRFGEEVMPNKWWGIRGGYTVEILILYLERSSKFIQELPQSTKAELQKGDEGAFANYPTYKTQFQVGKEVIAYTKPQVNLLAAQAEWSVKQTKDKIKDFMEGK